MRLDIDFRAGGNSASYVMDGWAEQEDTHRWSIGRRSRLRLPRAALTAGNVLAICATPCVHPPALTGQTVMVAIDGRLLATVHMPELHVAAWRLPAGLDGAGDAVLTLDHLSQGIARSRTKIRNRQRLALMVHTVRVFANDAREVAGPVVEAAAPSALAGAFESIGQACHFALVQRHYGAEPVSLLRFVDTTTAALYEGLVAGFAGVDAPDALDMRPTSEMRPTWRWIQRTFNLRFDTQCFVDRTQKAALLAQQVARLTFLRRKFLEDAALAEKIYVLTRSDCLTEPEALAVFCALRLLGPCTLLWTSYGNLARAGEVVRLAPGFLWAELGKVDEVDRYADHGVWLDVMRGALALAKPGQH